MTVAAELCPHCGADLTGDPIPDRYRHHNVPGEPYFNPNEPTHGEQVSSSLKDGLGERCFCLPWGDATHFSRKISVYDEWLDRTVEWVCPDCGGRWPR